MKKKLLIAFTLLLGPWLFQPLEVKAQSILQGETLQRQDEQRWKQQNLERRINDLERQMQRR